LPTMNANSSRLVFIVVGVVAIAVAGCMVSQLMTTKSFHIDGDFLPFLIFIPFFLIFNCVFGAIAGSIARKKGYSYGTYFVLAFFFNMVGLIVAIMMPVRSGVDPAPPRSSSEEPNGPIIQSTDVIIEPVAPSTSWRTPETWQCQHCAEVNSRNYTYCKKCGAPRPR
jgi:hypothetical protein